MAELQQPNIVGNFLAAYSSGLERQQQQQDAAYQRQRQAKADQMTEQKYNFDMEQGQIDRAISMLKAEEDFFSTVPDNVTAETLQPYVQRYSQAFGIPVEQLAHITPDKIPGIKERSGALLKRLQVQKAQADIAQSYAAARAADRANRPVAAGAPQAAPALPPLRPLSAQEQNAVIESDKTASAAETALIAVNQALALSPNAFSGAGSGTVASVANLIEEPLRNLGITGGKYSRRASDTMQYNALVKETILPQLKIIFGGAPTEGEREILMSIAGDSTMGYEARENLLKRMRAAIERRLQSSKTTAEAIRNRTYFLPQQYQQPSAQTLPQAQPAPATASAPPPPAPRSTVPPPPPALRSTVPPPPPGAKVIP